MSQRLHLALGDSAAGCLREACRNHGLPGAVFGIQDDLSHGPLDEGQRRIHYMQDCFRGYDDWSLWARDATDAFDPWRALIAHIDEEAIESVVIWCGANASESTFLAMACWWLADYSGAVLRVIPGVDGCHYVAIYKPVELAELFTTSRELTKTGRDALAADFLRIRDETGLLRRWEDDRITGISLDYYDHLLLASCTSDWTLAARVIGLAMSRCDGHNLMSDLFFSCRLQYLIDIGRIEADGNRSRIRDYAVRLVEA
ncbi:MAG: DUF3658 domain-containing protein [Chromatiales bacterium]